MGDSLVSEVGADIGSYFGMEVGNIVRKIEGSLLGESLVSEDGTDIGSYGGMTDGNVDWKT